MTRDYINEATDEEKREALRGLSASKPAQTLHERAELEAGLEMGRYRNLTKYTVGLYYPRMPSTSPWAGDPVPKEEPFGVDISAVEPVGTAQEVQASIDELHRATGATEPEPVTHPPSERGSGSSFQFNRRV
jgi:hypothetical protein